MPNVRDLCSTDSKPAAFLAMAIVKSPVPHATSSTFSGDARSTISLTAFLLYPLSMLSERMWLSLS